MTTTLEIGGMNCGKCVAHVKEALMAVGGVQQVEVTLDPGRATIEHVGVDVELLTEAVTEEGYEAQVIN